MTMNLIPLLAGGAGIAALAGGWSQIKSALERMQGVLLPTMELDFQARRVFSGYCWRVLRHTSSGPFSRFEGRQSFIRPLGRWGCVAYRVIGEHTAVFWRGWRPLFVRIDEKEHGLLKVRYLRWTFDPEKLLLDALRWAATAEARDPEVYRRFRVQKISGSSGREMLFKDGGNASTENNGPPGGQTITGALYDEHPIGWSREELGEQVAYNSRPTDLLALSGATLKALEHIRQWFSSRTWYREHGIPWRSGVLLEGPPGTGKSALTKAIGQELDLPIYLLDIATMDNKEFHKGFHEALSDAPSIVLVEDIDAVFDGRENIASERGKGLTFDCFLNTLSGVESSDGLLLIMTTNDKTRIDSALVREEEGKTVTRPGRIDRVVHMGTLDDAGRVKLATRIMQGCHPSWVSQMVHEGEGDTGAQFQLRCSDKALQLLWSGHVQDPAPNGFHRARVPAEILVETTGLSCVEDPHAHHHSNSA